MRRRLLRLVLSEFLQYQHLTAKIIKPGHRDGGYIHRCGKRCNLRIAVIRMDAIQNGANALKDLRRQKESYESQLRDELTRDQKALEKEKAEIEKSQDVLSRDALQRRIVDYQNRVAKLQQDLTERAQSIDMAFQKALNDVQANHLDPIIENTIAKRNCLW